MWSNLERPTRFRFDIVISDPDTDNPDDRITQIDIVTKGGAVVETFRPTPAHSVRWSPKLKDLKNSWFFVRVWNAGGGDESTADLKNPVSWLDSVWQGRYSQTDRAQCRYIVCQER